MICRRRKKANCPGTLTWSTTGVSALKKAGLPTGFGFSPVALFWGIEPSSLGRFLLEFIPVYSRLAFPQWNLSPTLWSPAIKMQWLSCFQKPQWIFLWCLPKEMQLALSNSKNFVSLPAYLLRVYPSNYSSWRVCLFFFFHVVHWRVKGLDLLLASLPVEKCPWESTLTLAM